MDEHTKEQRRHEQLTALDQLKREMRCFCRGVLPFTIQQLLVAWFMDEAATTHGEDGAASELIFEQIQQLRRKFERHEPLVQLELILWKNACLVNIPETIQSPFNYLLRGGWKEEKRVHRHDAMIGTVIQHVLPFLPPDYFTKDVVKSVTVSNAGFENVNGTYEKSSTDEQTYIKPGMYEGDAVTYILRKSILVPMWNLIIEGRSDPNNLTRNVVTRDPNNLTQNVVTRRVFYHTTQITNTMEELVPPAHNWRVSTLGRGPAPLVYAEIVPHYKMPPTYYETNHPHFSVQTIEPEDDNNDDDRVDEVIDRRLAQLADRLNDGDRLGEVIDRRLAQLADRL